MARPAGSSARLAGADVNRRQACRGFSFVELVVVLAIMAILFGLGSIGFGHWLNNIKIRSTADAIQAGLNLARGEAVRRNMVVRFLLVDTVAAGCVAVTSTSNWVVSLDDAVGDCAGAALNEGFPITDTVNNPAPRIIQSRLAAEGSSTVGVSAAQSLFRFNGLGRLADVPGVSPVVIDVTDPDTTKCAANGGKIRCLRVTVTVGGQIRMCDPAYDVAGTDPQRCPAAG